MNEKPLTVHEVVNLTGITARTLHYYDEIGLLKPSIVTEAKYRLYTDKDLCRLQEVLFFREVGFALKEIKKLGILKKFIFLKKSRNLKIKAGRVSY